jgi:hypothetical protein
VAVEDDARGLAVGLDVARGQQRVVGKGGADADRDGVGVGAAAVDALAALRRGEPAPGTAALPSIVEATL